MLSSADIKKIEELFDRKFDEQKTELKRELRAEVNKINEQLERLKVDVELNNIRSKIYIENLQHRAVFLRESVGQSMAPTGFNSRKWVTFEGPLY